MPTNRIAISIIIGTMSLLASMAVGTISYCSINGIEIPPELNTLAGGLVGSLASMLVKTSPSETTRSVDPNAPNGGVPPEVTVVNKPDEPVPTTEAKP